MIKNGEYDIAIVELDGVAQIRQCSACLGATVINLPKKDAPCPSGKELLFTGWGVDRYRKQDMPISRLLGTKFLFAIDLKCKSESSQPPLLYTTNVPENRNSPCKRDSGGKI